MCAEALRPADRAFARPAGLSFAALQEKTKPRPYSGRGLVFRYHGREKLRFQKCTTVLGKRSVIPLTGRLWPGGSVEPQAARERASAKAAKKAAMRFMSCPPFIPLTKE